MKKRWGTLLLAGLLGTAVLSGCGSSASDSASTAAADSAAAETTTSSENTKEDLIFVNYRDIRDLNPHLYAGEMYAQEMLYEGLVNITADGFEGCLAESWDVSEDGKVYTFHIRPGVLFCQYFPTDAAVASLCETGRLTGCCYRCICHNCMTFYRDFSRICLRSSTI